MQIFLQVLLAGVLGGLIGTEREYRGRSAGLRTFSFVAMGSALFTILSIKAFGSGTDPSRVAANVLTGIGFIGAGVIFRQEDRVRGITTAAGLWIVSAIGMAVACHYYLVAILGTATAVLSFIVLDKVDRWIHVKANGGVCKKKGFFKKK